MTILTLAVESAGKGTYLTDQQVLRLADKNTWFLSKATKLHGKHGTICRAKHAGWCNLYHVAPKVFSAMRR